MSSKKRRRLTPADFQRPPEARPHATVVPCHEHATSRTERKIIGKDGADEDNSRFVDIMACWRCWEMNPESAMLRLLELFEIPLEDQAEIFAYHREQKLAAQQRPTYQYLDIRNDAP